MAHWWCPLQFGPVVRTSVGLYHCIGVQAKEGANTVVGQFEISSTDFLYGPRFFGADASSFAMYVAEEY
jgi:hypothetical protein